MLVPTAKGVALQLKEEQLILDGRGDLVFISHGHSDHSTGIKRSRRIIASEETIDLIHSRNYADADETRAKLHNGSGFKYSLLNAGHVLGSKQFHLSDGFSFTYTGDFKTRDSLTNKGAEIRQAEVLLMETTFGSPRYIFPPTDVLYSEMAHWVNRQILSGSSVILGGYSLGKAQELIKLLNDYNGISPIVSSEIYRISQIYQKYGVGLKMINETSEEAKEVLQKGFVAVVPHHFSNFSYARRLGEYYKCNVKCAVATGWAVDGKYGVDQAFPLSDHCDYNELLEFVEGVSPQRVITTHGFEREFARELKKRGYNAEPLNNLKLKPQKMLLEY